MRRPSTASSRAGATSPSPWIPTPSPTAATCARRFDVLVLYDSIKDLDEPQRKNLRDFVEAGKGVVVLHHAIVDFAGTWPWWYEEVVGGRYLPTSTFKHDQQLSVTLVEKHPVTRGFAPMRLVDETYKGMWISPAVKVLLKTDHPTADGPVAWISPYEKSRVVYIKLGHGREAHEHPGYRQLVHNGILWSGAAEVNAARLAPELPRLKLRRWAQVHVVRAGPRLRRLGLAERPPARSGPPQALLLSRWPKQPRRRLTAPP